MKEVPGLEWRQQSRLLDQRDRLMRLLKDLRVAATNRSDRESDDITDNEAAIQADAIEGRLTAVDNAIHRIDSGVYGSRLHCGATISREWLEALPAAALCRDCAA